MEEKEWLELLIENFPYQQYPEMRPVQQKAFEFESKVLATKKTPGIIEATTGAGKTAIGFTFLKGLEKKGIKPLFYIVPTKSGVETVKNQHPEVKTMFGKNEYDCLFYKKEVKADQAACSLLDCPHYVDQKTGKTRDKDVEPCPYYQDKYLAKQGGIIVCTMSFYLFTQFFSKEWPIPGGLVIDEVHQIAKAFRNSLKYEITDHHLKQEIALLQKIDPEQATLLENFLKKMVEIIKSKPPAKPNLLEDDEIRELMNTVIKVKVEDIEPKIKEAIRNGEIDPKKERETLKKMEMLIRDLNKYYRSFEYSLPSEKSEKPLNYTYAYYQKRWPKRKRAQYQLVIGAHHVAPLVQKLLSPHTLVYSATIGDEKYFSFETGIKGEFLRLSSEFPVDHTRIFLPTDTPNLAQRVRKKGDVGRILRKIIEACKSLEARALVLVVSEKERKRFTELARELNLDALTYGNGLRPKETVEKFKEGEGQVLVGTVANFGESIDLPKNICPVIFFLRPCYPKPDDPIAVFEEKRYKESKWGIWQWRVMTEALQARGRNIRYPEDYGVIFFISEQFRKFVYGGLPDWLEDAYKSTLTFEEAITETKQLLREINN
ncbi:MAG: helicase C-terminal domain-containing protein [Patescibacteria group bacterium]|nr:helicase C-terminal domain-containing protein [Patescibacteria group bacterium]